MTFPDQERKVLLRILSDLTGLEEKEITPHLPLLDGGYLTSLQVVELVTRIEDETGIRFQDHDITPENFQDLSRIVELLEARKEEDLP